MNNNINLFLKKIDLIQYLQKQCCFSYQEIAYILNDHPKVVETYCVCIIASEQRMMNIKRLKN